MTRIKICGITNLDDLSAAERFGADSVGFILAKSPRKVSLEEVRDMTRELSPFIDTVAVTVSPSHEELEIIRDCGLFSHIQIHGKICHVPRGIKSIRAFSVDDERDLREAEQCSCDYILLDNGSGGTGKTFNWARVENRKMERPFILAGGLGVLNLADAIDRLSPVAVDVNSAIEISPGKKDHYLMREAIKLAHSN